MSRIAHTIKEKSRTDDVIITDNVDFSSLLLSKSVAQGLTNSGFYKPSPIQLKAIPLGRCGLGTLQISAFFIKYLLVTQDGFLCICHL